MSGANDGIGIFRASLYFSGVILSPAHAPDEPTSPSPCSARNVKNIAGRPDVPITLAALHGPHSEGYLCWLDDPEEGGSIYYRVILRPARYSLPRAKIPDK